MGVVIDLIMPDGKLRKYIKGMVAIFMVFAMVSPLPFVEFDINFDNFFEGETLVDNNLLEEINVKKVAEYKSIIESELLSVGYQNVVVDISYDYIDYEIKINQIFVDLTNLVIIDKNLNIDKYTHISSVITKLLDIKEDDILFYGG